MLRSISSRLPQVPTWVAVALALVLLAGTGPSLFGQSAGVAGISGVVRDPSGAVVPNAKVEISSKGQGTLRNLTTNDAGVFTAPALTPGSGYNVKVTATGFTTYQVKDMDLQVGQTIDLKVALTVGATSTQVEVSGVAPLVQDTKTDSSTVVDNRSIQ